ncbi:MAG: hypothetical protein U5N26_06395 [Candidatus Marinimicrobia bacterium]|nr:hypothetical protein [Candidatus Neomarinimicrobiota bacterium]
MKISIIGTTYDWLDTHTDKAMSETTEFVNAVYKQTGLKIARPEEISYKMKYIDSKQLNSLILQ